MRKILLTVIALAALLLISCRGAPEDALEIGERTEAQTTYFVGDTFDSFVSGAAGAICRIPAIYVVKPDGTRSDDVSRSENVSFSGYDPNRVGEQIITVTYLAEDGKRLTASYPINVVEEKILFIEADDNLHFTSGSFRVGEKFTTFQTDDYGVGYGVTVWLCMDSEINPRIGYFTNEDKMLDAVFDTSACKLDENGRFTEPGVFTVKLSFRGFETSYDIRVTD